MLYIFDKDQTLVTGPEGGIPNRIGEQFPLPGVVERCAQLRADGHVLAVASNQGGVAFGYLSEKEACALVGEAGALIGAAATAVCLHHPQGTVRAYVMECPCRKPAPGMLFDLMDRLGFEADETVYVGDVVSDRRAAELAGVDFVWAKDFFKITYSVNVNGWQVEG